jgi:hypothetical protein
MRHFAELESLRAKLLERSDARAGETAEKQLAGLIDALEAAWRRAETEIDFGTYSDKHEDMRNLGMVQKHLEEAATAVEAACRQRLTYYRW